MEKLAILFGSTLGKYISAQATVFIISMIPILECRGGLVVSALLQVPIKQAVPLCVLGNILPIPFILLFIRRIFKWLKKFNKTRHLVEKLENRAMSKSDAMDKGEFLGLMFFVGIPLPGTGAWTGSLLAALLDIDFKKAIIACFIGILMATVIVASLSYGLLAAL